MNQRAYPEIGWRITISQGSGAASTGAMAQKPGAGAEPSVLRRRMDDELVVGPLRRGEGVLGEAHAHLREDG